MIKNFLFNYICNEYIPLKKKKYRLWLSQLIINKFKHNFFEEVLMKSTVNPEFVLEIELY